MTFHAILACATLLNLSMTTKQEMGSILPSAGIYCINNPTGKLVIVYRTIDQKGK